MNTIKDNIWNYLDKGYIVIPTNGTVKSNGSCVMGRGVALQSKVKFPGFDFRLGYLIKLYGNELFVFTGEPAYIITFPVKHNWYERADINLITKSTEALSKIDTNMNIYLPLVGCGNGKLEEVEVLPILEKYLSNDKFTLVRY